MIIAIIVLGILLVCAIVATIILKSDSKFWEDMYHDIFKWSNDVHNSNKEMIERCKEDIEFAQRVIDTNERLLKALESTERERQELATKLLKLEKQNEEEGTIHA